MTSTFWFLLGLFLILITLWDGFSFVQMNRKSRFRTGFSTLIERCYWQLVRLVNLRVHHKGLQSRIFSTFTPAVVISLLIAWSLCLIYGFALLSWASGEDLHGTAQDPTFPDYFYLSGVTFFTLGYGDLSPAESFGQVLSLVEVGCGYSFIAIIIGLIPTISTIGADREMGLLKMQLQTGSVFSAAALFSRSVPEHDLPRAEEFFNEYSDWVLKVHMSQLNYPVLCYQRSSGHDLHWLSGVALVLDVSAIFLAWFDQKDKRAAFNLHDLGTLALAQFDELFWLRNEPRPQASRISHDETMELWAYLGRLGFPLKTLEDPAEALSRVLARYEPNLQLLADYLLMPLPSITAVSSEPKWHD